MACVNEGSQFYLPPTRLSTNRMSHPAITPQPQRIAALWPVLISRPTKDRKLSWPGRLVRWLVCPPEDGHRSQYQPTKSAAVKDRTVLDGG